MDVGGATTTTKMTSTMNTITYFCCDSECDKPVATYGAPCCLEHNPLVGGLDETLSHETSECPGCGMDLYVGANGYCSYCWVERFGCDDEEAPPCSPSSTSEMPVHKCCGEWDYERGIRVCDFADEPGCPQHVPAPCACRNSPMCKACEQANGYSEWDDHYDGSTYDCTNCKREFKNKYWRNQSLCRDCEDLPPLPMSPIRSEEDELEDQIASIKEKVELYSRGMTPAQVDDWRRLWMIKEKRLHELRPECTPWEDYDTDDLRKLDTQMRHMYC